MAMQTKILTRKESATVKKLNTSGTEVDAVVKGGVGTLAIGKVGDIVSRAYGPVAHPYKVTSATDFGAFISGQGILVNPNDCAGLASVTTMAGPFFDATGLKSGQVGTVLVSGACVIKRTQYATINTNMNVQSTYGYEHAFDEDEWTEIAAYSATTDYLKDDLVVYSNTVYKAKADKPAGAWDASLWTAQTTNAYSNTSDYAVGALVTQDSKFYVCKEAIADVMEVEVNGFKS